MNENIIINLLIEIKDLLTESMNESQSAGILEYLPYILSGLTLISSVIIVYLQHKQNIAFHKTTTIYNTKNEAIEEALAFLDTYISWLDINSGIKPVREQINRDDLTFRARTIYNKLLITCDNTEIINKFIEIVIPNITTDEGYPVFKKYNEFRNACRKELGLNKINLPDDKIFLSVISTNALNKTKQMKPIKKRLKPI